VKLSNRERYPWQVITGDAMAISALLDYRIITSAEPLHVKIDRSGNLSRGRSVIDWSAEANWVTAQVVLSINQTLFMDLMNNRFGKFNAYKPAVEKKSWGWRVP